MTTGLFPGQGLEAQVVADGLATEHPRISEASAFLGIDLCREVGRSARRAPQGSIPTDLAQVAIFVAGMAAFEEASRVTAFERLIGHSLGEYAALVAAGSLSFVDGLKVVAVRGRAMKRAALTTHGGMAATVGIDLATAERICDLTGVYVANDNSQQQVVIAGTEAGLTRAAQAVSAAGGRTVRLPVDGAFHTPAMAPAAADLEHALERIDIRSPRIEVISNVTAAPYRAPGEIRKLLVRQLTETVRFRESIHAAVIGGGSDFMDIGPGRVVGRLADVVLRGMGVARV